jgi:peptide/nickel transport system ATP-binding protein
MSKVILSVRNLSVQIPTDHAPAWVVRKVSFDVNKAECVALVGESGSGKTLSALSALQLLPEVAVVSQHSEVLWQGDDLLAKTEKQMRGLRGAKISMIFQDAQAAFNPVLTIGQQIDETIRLHAPASRSSRRAKALHWLAAVGLPDPLLCYRSYPHELSGGMKQRAMIALAIACEPDLLIADEPCTALDVTIQAQVLQLLKKLQDECQMAILFISHDLAQVRQMAERVVVMKAGRVVEKARSVDFFQGPQSAYGQKLLSAVLPIRARLHPVAEPQSLLAIHELKVYFPIKRGLLRRTVGHVKAVQALSLQMNAGETLALVGESGSGKTTTAKVMVDLVKATQLQWQKNIADHEVQMVFQDPFAAMNPRMMILDMLLEGLRAKGERLSPEQAQAVADDLLLKVGLLPEHKWRYPHQFSGGQRQRLCIARCLALEPKLLILDEPTSALDVSTQREILDLLLDLQKKLGCAYLLITHHLGVVAYMAHRMAVMYHGRIVESGTVASILHAPTEQYTRELLAAVPSL